MAQPVSSQFLLAQAADANSVVSKVSLILGNYCNAAAYGTTIGSSGDDASGNYPALGAIDGDRTEINIGASAAADNNVGKSSWRSSVSPASIFPVPVTLTINFNTSRTINRLKLYHLNGHGLNSFTFQYWNGSAWVSFASTTINATPTNILTTGKLDIINFPDITTTQIQLNIYGTAVSNDLANVVEVEAYRVLDITSRVKAIKQTRQRDYKLVNPMAAAMQVDVINTDRFFSVSHVPTTAEVAAGFVNSELQPGAGIVVQMGFNYYGPAPELVTVFTGEIDSITISPSTRDGSIQHRDVMKKIINNQADSSKLKAGLDISACIQYVLNRANISTYEMALDSTGINIPYFFTDNEAQLDTIRDLAQAAGDTIFYIDELGIPTFKDFTASIPNQNVYTSEIDWEHVGATLFNISTTGAYADMLAVPPQYFPDITAGAYTGDMADISGLISLNSSSPFAGASFNQGGGTMEGYFTNIGGGPTNYRGIYQPYNVPRAGTINTITIGGWQTSGGGFVQIQIWADSSGTPVDPSPGSPIYTTTAFNGNQSNVTVHPNIHLSAGNYWIVLLNATGTFIIKAQLANSPAGMARAHYAGLYAYLTVGGETQPAGLCSGFTFTYDTVAVSGTFTSTWYDSGSLSVNPNPSVTVVGTYPGGTSSTIFLDGSDDGSSVAVTYSVNNLNGSQTFAVAQHEFWRLRISAAATDNVFVPTFGNFNLLFGSFGVWTNPTLDTGASTTGFGSITYTAVLNGGTVSFVTRSSYDGITWSPYIATSMSGVILSPLARYLEVQVLINLGPGGVTPIVLDVTVGWTSGGGSLKYPLIASFEFEFDSQLLAVQQSLADNLGGDSSILNDVIVQAQPLVLTGTTSDTVWQGTIGIPPINISGSAPLAVTSGQVLVFTPYVSGGMDISLMTGADPAAAVVTFSGGASGSWAFSNIHPTLPVLTITITGSGNIIDLRIIGETYQNASYLQAQEVIDQTSKARYGLRQLSISNNWITSVAAATAIAQIQLKNYKFPVAYIPSAKVRLCPSIQLGDRVTISDANLDLTADYIVVGNNHNLSASKDNATIETDLVLMAIPSGS